MGYLCDFCGEQRSIVYCRSDAANLCLSCDRNVHSANALSKRHSRTLSCERCKSQPAFVRCIEEKISLCQNCDWALHAGSNTSPLHKRQALNCYSGCPSAAELSAIWSFLLDSPSIGDSTCEKEMGSMSITEGGPGGGQAPQGSNDVQDRSSLIEVSRLHNKEKKPGSASYAMPKVFLSGSKKPATVYEDNVFFDDFNMDEVDLGLENYEELFGGALNDHEQLFDSDGIDGIFGTKDLSGSNVHGDYTAEGSKVMQQPEYSTAASVDSIVSCKTEPPNLYFTTRPANSGISFSGLGGECSTEDYQDCGVSSNMIIMGEPPWQPPCPESSIPSSNRNDAVIRYMEKKKRRKFDKKVRYESRKARADVRKRVKGRFVKVGDAYDYDPLCETRSY